MHRSPAEPKPALTAAVGREVEVGVGQHDHVVLRAAERLHALAGARRRLVDVARDRRRADERDGLDVGVLEQPVDRDLVAVHDVEHARRAGRPRPTARAIQFAADGSFSLGLSITVLPAAIAIGKNQHGTIAGKLNGLMIATTPSGWRIEYTSTRVDTPSGEAALQQLRHAARELDDLEPARHLPARVARAPCRART